MRSTLGIFDAIVFGAALIALLVGAFSVINTMTIAVTERTREIGIRKAIGATDGSILLTFVGEAATIGALGGVVGIALGLARGHGDRRAQRRGRQPPAVRDLAAASGSARSRFRSR